MVDSHENNSSDTHNTHHHADDLEHIGVGIVTITSTRSLDDDQSGDAIVEATENAGHSVITRELVGDESDRIQQIVATLVGRKDIDIVVTTGGTGVTPDDVTVEAVRPLFEKKLPGFGELFRHRSEAEIGTRVIGTRVMAGIADGVPIFCLPGSVNAVQLGMDIVLPEAGHLASLARPTDH